MNKNTSLLAAATWLLLLSALATSPAKAQTAPPLINYQGKLVSTNGLPVSTGDYELRFRIWDAPTGGSLVWGPQVFNGHSGPGFGPLVPVVQGWFNAILGPIDTNGQAIADAFAASNRFVEIQLGANPQFISRQQILSAPFALRSSVADTAVSLLGHVTTGPKIYYVSTNGLDSNDGVTLATPKRTIQAAVDLVPQKLMHHTVIKILPGIYRESVEITGKNRVVNQSSLQLIGMGATADAVRISGANELGQRVRPYALLCFGSDATAYNITFEECSDTGVAILNRSNSGFTQCNFWNFNGEAAVEFYSFAMFENCYFERFGARGNVAIGVEINSYCGFRNDHLIPRGENGNPDFVGDPSNILINTFKHFNTAIRVRGGSTLISTNSLVFSDVMAPVQTFEGGSAF